MADSYSIESPVTLFPLSSSGQKQAGSSYSISGGKKRKRTEIVLGNDGESVNIYDIKAPRLVLSYAIPAQARLTAPPCSVYSKSTTSKSSSRYTYAALANELRSKRQEIHSYSYTATKAQMSSATGAESKQLSWKSTDDCGAIIKLEAVPTGDDHELLAIHASGKLRGFSKDVTQQIWEHDVEGSVKIEHAIVQSAAEARQGLLKNREDLLGILGTSGKDQDSIEEQTAIITLICLDTQNGARNVHVLALDPPTPDVVARISSRVHVLIKWTLAGATSETKKHSYSFERSSGTLFDLFDDELSTYSFTILGPQLVRKIPQLPDAASVDAFLPLPRSLVLMSTPANTVIVNTQYSSILASREAPSPDIAAQSSRKRKHDGTNGVPKPSSVHFCDYFRTLNLAIGVQDGALVAFQLRFPSAVRGRGNGAAKHESRMIESLGKGIPSNSENTRRAIPAVDASAVDEIARSDPSLGQLAELFVASSVQPAPYVSLDGLTRSLRWILRSFSTPSIDADQKLASADESPAKKLKANGVNGTHATTSSTETDTTEALLRDEEEKADADLSLAVALITASSQSQAETPNARAQTLHTVLTRLGTHFTSSTTALPRSLRTNLSQHDLFLLIELLRHALEQGGWASKTLDVYPSDSDEGASPEDIGGIDSSVRVIGTLISAAIDALGAGAWLNGGVDVSVDTSILTPPSSDDGSSEAAEPQRMLLPTLRHLTASVLEVTQEAAFFRHFLADFLRYADALAGAPHGVQARLAAQRSEAEKNILPMGVRQARGISETTIRAGGEVRVRSKRDLAHEIQKGVGVYTFERLRV